MYLQGEGVTKDYKKAYNLYVLAEKKGSVYATGRIGEMYYYGYYVKQNFDKAFQYLSKAASFFEGTNAMRLLAACYRYGNGTKPDQKKEEYWMKTAAAMGDEKARHTMK